VGGVAGAAVVGTAAYGRFVVGDEFEEHVARVLGTSTAVASELLAGARERIGSPDYELRAAEFLAATVFPTDVVAPHRARNRAVRRLLPLMVTESRENLMLLGLQSPRGGKPCTGLVQS
jgi:hypothetical protein